jgi:hypothetical protein
MVVHRARNADEARKVRVALEGAQIPVDLPDQAIDAWFAAKTEELHIKVALKHWKAATKAIDAAFPPEQEPEPKIHEAEDRRAAADAQLTAAPEAPQVDKSKEPASAVDKSATRAFYVLCASLFGLFPIAVIAAVWGASVWSEMASRPDDYFRRKTYAQIATFGGAIVGTIGTFIAFVQIQKRFFH